MGNMRNKKTTYAEREAQWLEKKVAQEATHEKKSKW
jgi:hypothetical protein